ncbi:extracellular solute-binding protein [Microlunatus sp. Y2014]|uniref:extracellular solute-binding protein n=1 Tax=Microlunatus sp. Y2014 TaxID=3418488 RepID=UPI003DA6FD57
MLSRRGLIGSGLALAAGATALAGCNPDGGGGGGTGGSGEAGSGALPNHIPFEGVTPDIPAGENGIPAAYLQYPANPVSTGITPLATSDPVSMLLVGSPPPVAEDKNSWYKLLTEAIGTQFEFTWGSWGEYTDKYQVTIASGDVPDMVMMQTVAQFPQLLDTVFTDLTDFLGGDAIADYPGLAAFPTPSWEATQLNGRLWGIPQPRPPAGRVLSIRNDLAEQAGVGANPTVSNGEEFIALMTELTNAGQKKWAMGADPQQWLLPMLATMTGAPNQFAESDGVFTYWWETPEFKLALEQAVKIWNDGLLHPQSATEGSANLEWWSSGATTLYSQAFTGWASYAPDYPDWDLGAVILPKWDGGGPAGIHLSDAAYSSWVGIAKQDSDDKVRELLAVADYLASPFGTKEFVDINYGIEGTHHTLEGTDPIPNGEATKQEQNRSLRYVGDPYLSVLYVPGQQDVVKDMHAYLTEVMPGGVADASTGLYSETSVTEGSAGRRKMADLLLGIIVGRNDLSEFDGELKNYQESVGKKINEELAEAKANS